MDSHDVAILTRQFERVGARLRVEATTVTGRWHTKNPEPYTLDVSESERGSREETYLLKVRPDAYPVLNFAVLDVQPRLRHLLLLAKPIENGAVAIPDQSRFLCGHDERHWFVAAVKNGTGAPTGVTEAMESLKPSGIAAKQRRDGVRAKDWHRRKNASFMRQGEWFFVPDHEWEPSAANIIYHNEPIRRSNTGKPHQVEMLCRTGGEIVYVCSKYPRGVSPARYEQLLKTDQKARGYFWQQMRRNPQVYAKGRVRHSDHATILLPCWHRVLMNDEVLSSRVAFLD